MFQCIPYCSVYILYCILIFFLVEVIISPIVLKQILLSSAADYFHLFSFSNFIPDKKFNVLCYLIPKLNVLYKSQQLVIKSLLFIIGVLIMA